LIRIGKPIQPLITLSGKSGNVEICKNSYSVLDAGAADPLNNEEYIKYKWYENNQLIADSVSQFLVINKPGTYSVDVLSLGGCTGSSEINVSIIPFPVVSITHPLTACTGGVFKLTANIDANPGDYTVKWLNTQGLQARIPTGNQRYY